MNDEHQHHCGRPFDHRRDGPSRIDIVANRAQLSQPTTQPTCCVLGRSGDDQKRRLHVMGGAVNDTELSNTVVGFDIDARNNIRRPPGKEQEQKRLVLVRPFIGTTQVVPLDNICVVLNHEYIITYDAEPNRITSIWLVKPSTAQCWPLPHIKTQMSYLHLFVVNNTDQGDADGDDVIITRVYAIYLNHAQFVIDKLDLSRRFFRFLDSNCTNNDAKVVLGWRRITRSTNPPYRSYSATCYSPSNRTVYFFGGFNRR